MASGSALRRLQCAAEGQDDGGEGEESAAAVHGPHNTDRCERGEPQAKALPADAPPCVRAFFEAHVVEADGGRIGAGELYAAYATSCASEPITRNKFGRVIGKAWPKDGGRYPAYVGIALRGPRLAAVA